MSHRNVETEIIFSDITYPFLNISSYSFAGKEASYLRVLLENVVHLHGCVRGCWFHWWKNRLMYLFPRVLHLTAFSIVPPGTLKLNFPIIFAVLGWAGKIIGKPNSLYICEKLERTLSRRSLLSMFSARWTMATKYSFSFKPSSLRIDFAFRNLKVLIGCINDRISCNKDFFFVNTFV